MNTPASDTAWGEPNRRGINCGAGRPADGPLTQAGGDVEADARGDVAPSDTPASAGRISRISSLSEAVRAGIDGPLPAGVPAGTGPRTVGEATTRRRRAPEAPHRPPPWLAPSILRAGP